MTVWKSTDIRRLDRSWESNESINYVNCRNDTRVYNSLSCPTLTTIWSNFLREIYNFDFLNKSEQYFCLFNIFDCYSTSVSQTFNQLSLIINY